MYSEFWRSGRDSCQGQTLQKQARFVQIRARLVAGNEFIHLGLVIYLGFGVGSDLDARDEDLLPGAREVALPRRLHRVRELACSPIQTLF